MPEVKVELTLLIKHFGGETWIEAKAPGIENLEATKITLNDKDITAFADLLQQGSTVPSNKQVQKIGQMLYGAIFIEPVKERLAALRTQYNGAIRLRLIIQEALIHYPWETLHDGQDYLATLQDMPLVRSILTEQSSLKLAPVDRQLKVLYVGASPDTRAILTAPTRLAATLNQYFSSKKDDAINKEEQKQRERVALTILVGEDATLANLGEKLQQDFHVLCFVGHGGVETYNNDTAPVLYLWNDEDADYFDHITPGELVNKLRGTNLRLVILAACNSDALHGIESFASAITGRAYIPAVVTMQTLIQEETAENFLLHFFKSLAVGAPVDVATAASRQEIQTLAVDSQTIAPVLYLQAADSHIFKQKRNWTRQLAVAVITLLVLIPLIIGGALLERNRLETRTEVEIGNEQQLRLQSETQRDRLVRINTAANPTQPIFHNGLLWLTQQGTNTAQAYTLTGQPYNTPLPTGTLPGNLITQPDSPYLWSSNNDGSLTRIDSALNTATTITTVSAPLPPLINQDTWVWVAARSGGEMVQVAQEQLTTEQVTIPRNIFPPFIAGQYVWVASYRESSLLRFDVATRDAQEIPLPQAPATLTSAYNSIWILTDQELLQLDIEDGQVEAAWPAQGATTLQAADGLLWLTNPTEQTLQSINPGDKNSQATYSLEFQPGQLYSTPGRLWINEAATDRMHMMDSTTGAILASFEMPGGNQISGIGTDGEYAWFTVGAQGFAQAVRIHDGEPHTRLAICSGLSSPLFDGTNMWFACPQSNQLIFVPAIFYQFDISGFQKDSAEHTPLVYDDLLWISIESGGRIIAYDQQQQEVHRLAPGAPLMPLQADDKYLWTAIDQAGQLVRIQTTHPLLGESGVQVDILSLSGEITAFHLIGDKVWVLTADISNFNAPNLHIIQRDSLATIASHHIELVGSSLTPIEEDVWFSAASYTQSSITRLDARTGTILEGPIDIPYSTLGAWNPVAIDTTLWFTLGAPSLGNAGEILADEIFGQPEDKSENAVGIAAFNPINSEWIDFIPLYNLMPSRPVVDAPLLWYSSFGDAVPVIIREEEGIESGIFAVNVATKTVYGPWPVCETTYGEYVVGPYIWVGCSSPETQFTLLSRDPNSPQIICTYDDLGSSPWTPIVIGDYAWFVFRDTDNAAVFHVSTGELLQIYKLGPTPAQPVLFDDAIWVYNTGDGSLQRIAPIPLGL